MACMGRWKLGWDALFYYIYCVFWCVADPTVRWKCCSYLIRLMPIYIFQEIKGDQLSCSPWSPWYFYWTQTTLYCIIYYVILSTVYIYISFPFIVAVTGGVSVKWKAVPVVLVVLYWYTRTEEAFCGTLLLMASVETLSHIVYASNKEKINSKR